ncbi:prion-like-(Q/N-rich) domain-bearing protein 25 [Diachasma alloeum]|uniref:prion-like-(Q/N-rich) domain-bearing protein 25 n=1 Tax=Diachasma alloeum TaxID=454923 RepID=UPI0007381AE6|nr:prion-like-(Q/N-rich) domain-bearing protein 25 [Diachasma alloeum]
MGLHKIFVHVLILLQISGNFQFYGCNGEVQYPLQCSRDVNCMVNSVCEKNQCKCRGGYVFSGNMTTCLKVANSYGEACDENHQCASYLSVGGACSSGKCVCSPGYHYLHGYCYKTTDLGETCLSPDNCYVNHQPEAAICENKKCRCSDNFYQREYRSCRRAAQKIGDECLIDLDCRFNPRATCGKSKRCQLETSGILLHGEREGNSRKTLKGNIAVIGKPCNASADCNPMGAAICSALGVCVCDRAHFPSENGDKCIAELGATCENDAVPEIRNAECREDVTLWSCKSGQVATIDNRECKKATTRFNSSCLLNEQCFVFGPDAICRDRKCICNDDSHYVEDQMICWTSKGLGERCRQDEDCHVNGLDVDIRCNDEFVCSCPNGTHVNGDQTVCIADHNEIGGFCIENGDCSVKNSICSNKSCTCADNHFESSGECVRGNFASCEVDQECKVYNSVCRNGTCTCHNYHVALTVDLCVPVSDLDDECNHDIQCSARNPNSVCKSIALETGEKGAVSGTKDGKGRCACADGYHYNYDGCFKKRVLKETCQTLAECYIESHTDSVLCKNGICSCNFGWRAVNNSHCESGATALISNYTWVLLLALSILGT